MAEEPAEPGPLVVSVVARRGDRPAFTEWLIEELAARPGAGGRLALAIPEDAGGRPAAIRSVAVRTGEFGGRLALDGFGRVGAFGLLKRSRPSGAARRRARARIARLRSGPRGRARPRPGGGGARRGDGRHGLYGAAELTAVRGFGIALAQGERAGDASA